MTARNIPQGICTNLNINTTDIGAFYETSWAKNINEKCNEINNILKANLSLVYSFSLQK